MYIVISGNTGAGKSTLGQLLCNELKKKVPCKYIDERNFQHELVQQMFDCPTQYAFLIQMNFLLERTLKIKQLTENNQMFLMERSLNEDFLFAYRHYQLNNISSEEFAIYKKFWENCLSMTPLPSLFIYLYSHDSNFLTKKVIEGYTNGTRNMELPREELQEYVIQMNRLYDDWFERLDKDKIKIPSVEFDLKTNKDFVRILKLILTKVETRH